MFCFCCSLCVYSKQKKDSSSKKNAFNAYRRKKALAERVWPSICLYSFKMFLDKHEHLFKGNWENALHVTN